MMDIIFAIVVGMSLDTLFESDARGRVFWGLVGAYVVILLSWMGYHRSLHEHRYLDGGWSSLRFAFDYAIVVLYAYLLWLMDKDVADPARMGRYLTVYAGLFLLYMLSGMVRRIEYGSKASHQGKLWAALTAMAVLLALYHALLPRMTVHALDRSAWLFLAAPVAIHVGWRAWRRVGG